MHVIRIIMTENIAQLKDTDHTRSYDTNNTLVHFTALTVSQVSLAGRSGSGLCLSFVVATVPHSPLMPDLCHDWSQ